MTDGLWRCWLGDGQLSDGAMDGSMDGSQWMARDARLSNGAMDSLQWTAQGRRWSNGQLAMKGSGIETWTAWQWSNGWLAMVGSAIDKWTVCNRWLMMDGSSMEQWTAQRWSNGRLGNGRLGNGAMDSLRWTACNGQLGNGVMGVRMSDCCLQGIQPCKCKGEEHRWVGNQVFRWLGLTKETKEKWDLWKRSPKTFRGI